MPFVKSFPRTVKGSSFPLWEEISLNEDEELAAEEKCRQENIRLFSQCLDDAKQIITAKGYKEYQADQVLIAVALFEKRASHSVFHKESKAKEKFDKQHS